MTLAVPSGCTITKVLFTGSGNGLSTTTGTLTTESFGYTWTGSTSSLTLSAGTGDRDEYRIQSISVTLEADLNVLASVSGSVATYDFTTNAEPFIGVSLGSKTITAGDQEIYLMVGNEDPTIQQSMTNMATYLNMPANGTIRFQPSDSSSDFYITKVKFNFASGSPSINYSGINGEYDPDTQTWTGRDDQLDIDFIDEANIQSIEVTAVELFKLSVSTQGRGKISVNGTELTRSVDPQTGYLVSSTEEYIEAGSDVVFVITPDNERFYTAQASDNTESFLSQIQSNTYTISNISDRHSVYVRFDLTYNHITYGATGDGTIKFSATSLDANDEEDTYEYPMYGDPDIRNTTDDKGIPYGATPVTFTMTADTGKKLSSFTINTQELLADVTQNGNVYTYTLPYTLTSDITVMATFVSEAPEPYAQVSDGILTFFYDTNRGDSSYDVEAFASAAARGWGDYKGSISTVVFSEDFKSNYAITSMAYWFSGMSALENISLEGLNVSGLTDVTEMFSGCSALKTIYADNSWPTSGLSGSNVFEACTLLVGGRGTSFATAGDTGASYARIDKAPSAPGYFTGPDDESSFTLQASENGAVVAEVQSPTGSGAVETYNISQDSGERSRTIYVPAGYEVKLTMTPAEYYSLGKLTINTDAGMTEISGTDYTTIPEVSGSRIYTYENVIEASIVDVAFETTKHTVTLQTSAGGSINYTLDRVYGNDSPTGTVTNVEALALTVDHFSNLTLQFVPDANYSFTKLLADDSDATGNVVDNAITLNSFNDNITYSATFTMALHTVNLAATANGTYRAEIVDAPDGLDKTYVDVYDEDQTIDVPNGYSLKLSITSNDNYTLGLVNIDGVTVPTADITPTSDHEWNYTIADGSTVNNISVTFAEKAAEPYARLEDGTMTFYYNNQKTASDYEVKTFASAEERGWNNDANTVTTVAFDESFKGGYAITSMAYWFSGMTSLTAIDFTGLNVSGLGDVSGMFAYCVNLSRVDVDNNWPGASETGGVSGSGVFTGCAALEGARGTKFSTASVVDASYARIDKQPSKPGYFWGPDIEYQMSMTVGEHGSVVAIVSKNDTDEDIYDGITSTAPQTIYVPSGYSVTLRMTPDLNYQFSKYYEGTTEITSGFTYDDGATVYTYAENAISNDFSASVEFALATYDISLSAGANGVIRYTLNADDPVEIGSEDTKQVTVTATSTLKLEVVPNAGYQLDKLLFTNGASSQEITVPENYTIEITTFDTGDTYTASFVATQFNITLAAGEHGSITYSTDGGATSTAIAKGESATIPVTIETALSVTATPDAGYKAVSVSNGTTETSQSFTFTGNVATLTRIEGGTYTVNYEPVGPAVTITITENGTVSGTVEKAGNAETGEDAYSQGYTFVTGTNDIYVPSGANLTLTLTPAANYDVTVKDGETDVTVSEGTEGSKTATIADITEAKSISVTFAPVTYTITYDLDGGALAEGVTNPDTYTVETETFTLNNPTREGYIFAGWTGTGITEATATVTITKGSTGDRSYTATWTTDGFAITYDLAGGALPEGVSNPASYTVETETFTLNNPVKPGYTFAGWTGTDLTEPTTTVTITQGSTGTRSYTATWSIITYNITYDLAGGALAEGVTNPATYTVESEAITLNNPTREGYTFAGWTGTGLTETTVNVTIENGSTGDREYTATWIVNGGYAITYDLAGGTLPEGQSNPASYTIESEDITLVNPVREGYTFAGWTGTDLTEATMTVVIPTGSTGDRSYTANWSVVTYTITYDLAGGSLAEGDTNPESYSVETETFTLNNPTREGYIFAGWTGTGITEATATVTITKGSTGDRSYTATWTTDGFAITYDLAGGALPEGVSNPASYTVETETFTLNNPTREGYTFVGWTGTGLTEATTTVTIEKGSTGERSYTANWSVVTYTITYDLAGGALAEGVTNPATYTVESDAITLNNPTREGYTFAGWTGTGLTEATVTVVIPTGSTENREYTATWILNGGYAITYDLAGGSLPEGVSNPTSYTIETETFTLNNPVREGYTFAGWTGTGLTEATMTVTIEKGSTGNRSYTATWSVIEYTITYDLAGGSWPEGVTNPTYYTIETETFKIFSPVREGYTFTGWTGTGLTEPTVNIAIEKGSMGDREYTATYVEDIPVPTIDSNGTMTVEGDLTMAQAIDAAGGAAEVNEQITSLIWNSTVTLTNSDLDVFTNPNMLVFVADATKYDGDRNNVVVNGTAKNVVLTDVTSGNGNFYCPQMFVAEKISYTHAYNQKTQAGVSRGWESIAMPFDVETITHETNGLIAPFGNEANEKHFWLRAISENGLVRATKIEANNAYLISMPNSEDYPAEYNLNGQVTFSSEYVEVPVTRPNVMEMWNSSQERIRVVPTFQHQTAEQNIYALNVGEARDTYAEGSVFVANLRDIRPFEVYTIHESNGQQPAPMYMPIGSYFNDLTGIEELHFAQPMNGKWFDMNGRQLQQAPTGKGVYIYNGKKHVIK